MKYLLFIFLSAILFSFTNPVASDKINVIHYTFHLELNDTTDIIAGLAEIDLEAKKDFTEFTIDLIGRNAMGKGMEVTSVTRGNTQLEFSHQSDVVKIFLGSTIKDRERLKVSIAYKGIPQEGLIISKNLYGDRTFFADNWPNRGRNWIPVIDHPADKASVSFNVKAPVHYEVIANGIKTEESYLNPQQKLTRYVEEKDIPTKVMVIGVARFAIAHAGTVNHVPVESWVYPQNRDQGFYDYAVAADIISFFSSHIAPYPYQKLANVQSKTTYGGLENASAIFYHEGSVTGKRDNIPLIAHEIAHQWFGDSASEKDWVDVWLSEGFATYFSNVYHEFAFGDHSRASLMADERAQVIAFSKTNRNPIVLSTLPEDLVQILNKNVYEKAGWVLHMLRKEVGDELFWKGIQNYYLRYQHSNASTSDFRKVMEEVTGKDLTAFFKQWLYTPGHPILEGTWAYDEKTKTVKVSIKQTQGNIFKFPLKIGIYQKGTTQPELKSVTIDKQSQGISFSIASKPERVELDPHVNLLFEGGLKKTN